MATPSTLAVADVADRLGCGRSRVLQLDRQLRPERDDRGHRRYSPSTIEAFLGARAARGGQ